MKVAVGSTNPVKVAAARSVIERVWPGATIASVVVPSGVRPMPLSDAECIEGAKNRAVAAQQVAMADLGIGIDGKRIFRRWQFREVIFQPFHLSDEILLVLGCCAEQAEGGVHDHRVGVVAVARVVNAVALLPDIFFKVTHPGHGMGF